MWMSVEKWYGLYVARYTVGDTLSHQDESAFLHLQPSPNSTMSCMYPTGVRDIVRRAVDEKERSLREQYERILQQKLQEQYQAFAKFNEDYISRSLKSSDLGYVS